MNKKNPENIKKNTRKKKKIPKPLEPFYAIQNLELSSLANHGDRHFFKTLPPPPPPSS